MQAPRKALGGGGSSGAASRAIASAAGGGGAAGTLSCGLFTMSSHEAVISSFPCFSQALPRANILEGTDTILSQLRIGRSPSLPFSCQVDYFKYV